MNAAFFIHKIGVIAYYVEICYDIAIVSSY